MVHVDNTADPGHDDNGRADDADPHTQRRPDGRPDDGGVCEHTDHHAERVTGRERRLQRVNQSGIRPWPIRHVASASTRRRPDTSTLSSTNNATRTLRLHSIGNDDNHAGNPESTGTQHGAR